MEARSPRGADLEKGQIGRSPKKQNKTKQKNK